MEETYQEENEDIERTVQKYIDGVVQFNIDLAEEAWHPEGVKISYNELENKLEFITIIQSRPKEKPSGIISYHTEIKEINRVGQAASVELQWIQKRNGSKMIYTDFISLLKIKNQWKIVSKVYDVKKMII